MKLGPLELFVRKEIGLPEDGKPLLIRWKLVAVDFAGIYLHKFMRSDYERALHDHPWGFLSLVLKGGYDEEHDNNPQRERVTISHRPGAILYRPPKWRHRVILRDDKPSWTLVVVGPRVRAWGFWVTVSEWCPWKRHNPFNNVCETDDLPFWNGGVD
jgi:hypothetical protein